MFYIPVNFEFSIFTAWKHLFSKQFIKCFQETLPHLNKKRSVCKMLAINVLNLGWLTKEIELIEWRIGSECLIKKIMWHGYVPLVIYHWLF